MVFGIVPSDDGVGIIIINVIGELQAIVLVQGDSIIDIHARRGGSDHKVSTGGRPSISNGTGSGISSGSKVGTGDWMILRHGFEFVAIVEIHATCKIAKSSESEESSVLGPDNGVAMCMINVCVCENIWHAIRS